MMGACDTSEQLKLIQDLEDQAFVLRQYVANGADEERMKMLIKIIEARIEKAYDNDES